MTAQLTDSPQRRPLVLQFEDLLARRLFVVNFLALLGHLRNIGTLFARSEWQTFLPHHFLAFWNRHALRILDDWFRQLFDNIVDVFRLLTEV